ncbi:MAG: type I DNA topoisomerase [Defluviicoccus sp.]|nr:type I DNA topoisomerase [Defluviicoccus sp.]
MNVVVVESPAKAKTITKYLGPGYTVLASYGHVRDLSAKDGSVRPEEGFAMTWEVDPKARKHVDAIASALKGADRLFLATDPDREGEAISWHVCELLQQKKALAGIDVKRVVFNSITRGAILDAFSQPRALNEELVAAYLARRALDYLVGFTLSPVLWRKLPGSRSAGRVQSVALRLICERETEIETFRQQEYWTVKGQFETVRGETFPAQLTHLDGRKLDKMALGDKAAADAAVAAANARTYSVGKVERKQTRRHPAPPFITSTLQQEASRKLSLSATTTMRIAQRLYEGIAIGGETVGLITYMRTDGVQMAADAIQGCRALIENDFGQRYLPAQPRIYKTKAKNAQEAHEAIRPTDLMRRPSDVAAYLDADQLKLYTLIWKRTVASQMESAVLDQVAADIVADDRQVIFRANGSVIAFDGFLKLYRESDDEPERAGAGDGDDAASRVLPQMNTDEAANRKRVEAEQHFTQPPPRYTEASLVKRLEELGIGRPSTYATILQVLQDRTYVRLESRRFVPEDRGRLVTAFLSSFFDRYVAYGFTADMEAKLDDVSGGRCEWQTVLDDFWREFSTAVEDIKGLRIKEVLDALDRILGPHFFRQEGEGDPRVCPGCGSGRLSLKLGRFGAFIGCSEYPNCRYTRPLVPMNADDQAKAGAQGNGAGRSLGPDPATGLEVSIRKGPYGWYVQRGSADNGDGKEKAAKPKRVSLAAGVDPETVDLDQALAHLALPRLIGLHPESGEEIVAGIGRFGPFLKMADRYVSLKRDDDVLSIGLNRAVDLLARSRPAAAAGRTIGAHPADGKPITLKDGRYGAYVQHGTIRATLPAGTAAEALDLETAVALLAKKAGATPAAKGRARGATKGPAKKTAAKAGAGKVGAKGAAEGKPVAADEKASAATKKAKSPRKPSAKGRKGSETQTDAGSLSDA